MQAERLVQPLQFVDDELEGQSKKRERTNVGVSFHYLSFLATIPAVYVGVGVIRIIGLFWSPRHSMRYVGWLDWWWTPIVNWLVQ